MVPEPGSAPDDAPVGGDRRPQAPMPGRAAIAARGKRCNLRSPRNRPPPPSPPQHAHTPRANAVPHLAVAAPTAFDR